MSDVGVQDAKRPRLVGWLGWNCSSTTKNGMSVKAVRPFWSRERERGDGKTRRGISPIVRSSRSGHAARNGGRLILKGRTTTFDVQKHFPNNPNLSNRYAQEFVDATLAVKGVLAFKNRDGVGFDPNFVFIERIYSRDIGFVASFYGGPEKHQSANRLIKKGRGVSYSRMQVRSSEDLEFAKKSINVAYKLRRF